MGNRDFARAGNGQMEGSFSGFRKPKDIGQVWYLDQNRKLAMEMVRIGMSDGTHTEILRSRNLKEGLKVITGTETAEAAKRISQNPNPGFGGGRGRPF